MGATWGERGGWGGRDRAWWRELLGLVVMALVIGLVLVVVAWVDEAGDGGAPSVTVGTSGEVTPYGEENDG